MKKILSTLLVGAALVVPVVSLAATLNNDPQDLATLRVANKTTNPAGSTTAWSSSANASAGQVVSFAIYYHNTSDPTAAHLRIRLVPQTTGASMTQVFTATVSADNASAVSGSATVYLSSPLSLTFIPGSVKWYPNQTVTSTALPFGQSGIELFNGSGLDLDAVASGWASQGSITVSFQVSNDGTNNTYYGSYGAPTVTTQGATNITGDAATLLGFLNPSGSTDTVRWFEYGTSAGFGYQTARVSHGITTSSYSTPLFSLLPNTTYYYRAVAQNAQGISYGSTLSFITGFSNGYTCMNCGNIWNTSGNVPVVATVSANPASDAATLSGYIDPRGTTGTIRWFEWGTSGNLNNQTSRSVHGMTPASYSLMVVGLSPNTTYYYRVAAQNAQGVVYGNTLSFVTTGNPTSNIYANTYTNTYTANTTAQGSAPAVTTFLATELTGDTARLNGLVFAGEGQSSNAWFEWGEGSNLNNKTTTFNVGALPVIKHDTVLSGLTTGNTYSYRIVAENMYGKTYGATMTFVARTASVQGGASETLQSAEGAPVHTTTTTFIASGGSAHAIASIALEGGAQAISNGEKRVYHVSWKNTNGGILKNVVVRVVLPAVMNFDGATTGMYTKDDNTLTLDVGNLASGATGEAFVYATAKNSGLVNGQIIVVTADIAYTTTANAQGDVVAYVTHKGVQTANSVGLGANILGAGSFLPTTIFEWMLLVVLVLVLVLLGNHLYGRLRG